MRLGLIPRIMMAASFAAASPAALAELIPPAPVNDLTVIVVSNNRVGLRWTATGDDGNVGRATAYDVRWAPGLITAANFGGANLAAGEPVPGNPGTIEQFAVFPLPASTTLSFALKVIDNDGNVSTISNVVIATTTAADQAAPAAVILAGTPSLLGQVSITWAAPGDDGPFGTVASYDLRRSLAPITTLLQFNAATPVVGEPPPAPAGTPQGMTVGGLQPGKDWYFAMRAFDEVGNGSSVPSTAMFIATLPQYLEFGPVTSLLRIETIATAYGAVTDLGGGSYRLTGSADVTMGGSTRPFNFVNLTTISGDTAGNGERALRVTAGSATVDAAAAPIPFPAADDLELSLYSFSLGPFGATTMPGVVLPPAGLVLKVPANLTTPLGDMLPLPPGVGVEQDLDFTSTMTAPGFWFAPRDYPFRIAPQVGVSYQVSRIRVDLGLSDLVYQGKERGEEVAPGVTRCAASRACDDEANDGIFGLAWNLNAAATPSLDRNGLRATLTHGPVGTTYTLFFPAGAQIALNAGSTIEFTNTEPSGGSLSGTLTVSLHSGAALTDFLDGFIITNDCTGEQTYSATFSGGQLLAGGQIQIGSLTPDGWTDLFFGGAGNYLAPRDPRGFFVGGGLDASRLSFYAPGTVARIGGARPTVEDHLLAEKSDGAIDHPGTYAGLNVRLDGLNPGTTGLDASCPPPPDPPGSGHSLSVNTTKTRVYVRRSGVTGTADVGSFVPPEQPFLYMGYDMALGRYGVSFRDNVPIDSGIIISNIIVPSPADVFFSFDTPATIDGCAEFSGRDLGNMVNAGAPQILACWEADFTPRAARFDQADCAGGPCAPVIPVNCPDIACAELRYLRVSSEAPLDLEPNDPPKPDRFRDLVPMDFTLEPLGPLACSDIILTGGAGSLRNKLENDYGFDIDLMHASLEPRDPACGAGPAPAAIGSGTPRYDVLGEILVPFYDAPGGCVRVTQGGGVETLRDCGSFDPVGEKVHVTRKILAGLVDLDFDLKYLPPIKVPGQETAARFVSESAVLDFQFMRLPASVKLFGALPVGLGSAPKLKPELYMGFLSDLAIFTEANPDLAACNPGSSCRTFLDEMMKLDNDALPTEIPTLDQVIPSLEAGASRLASRLGGNLRAIIADEMSSQFADGLPADIGRAAGRVKGVVDGVREVGAAVSQPFKALNLSGPGAFHDIPGAAEAQDWVLDQINIDADVDIAGFLNFKGFVNFNSHTANTEDEHAVEDTADVTVGAHDVDLGWAIDGVKAKTVQATFRFDPPPGFRVWGFDGEINLNGVKFGEVQFDELGFLLGMGNPTDAANDDYYYLAGMGRGKYKAVTAAGGFFLGKSDGIAPIERIDPEVGEVLEGLDTLTGIYVRAEASFPVLGGPECVPYRLNAGGGAAFWLFEEGPTFGAKIRAYATGSLVCAVTARADLTLLGGLTDDVWYLNGYGFLAGGVGWCEPNDWDTRRDVLNDDWCLSCVMDGEFSTSSDSGSGTIDGELHGPDCSGP